MPSKTPSVVVDDVYVSPTQAAAAGYGGYSTIRARIASGELPASRVGRNLKIRVSNLEAMPVPVRGRPTQEELVEAAINRLVSSAPELTEDQIRRLSRALGGDQ